MWHSPFKHPLLFLSGGSQGNNRWRQCLGFTCSCHRRDRIARLPRPARSGNSPRRPTCATALHSRSVRTNRSPGSFDFPPMRGPPSGFKRLANRPVRSLAPEMESAEALSDNNVVYAVQASVSRRLGHSASAACPLRCSCRGSSSCARAQGAAAIAILAAKARPGSDGAPTQVTLGVGRA